MKNFVLIPNVQKDQGLEVTGRVAGVLQNAGGTVYLSKEYSVPGTIPYTDFPSSAEAILVIGGDGSILDSSALSIETGVPILGINLGTVGYLSEVEPDALNELQKLIGGDFIIKDELLLCATVKHKDKDVVCRRLALNDIIVSHGSPIGIGNITLHDGRGESVKYRADGVIVSTPVGSTAYSLSAGGPIVAHGLETVVVTPVCAHSFFDRSILFSANETLGIENSGTSDLSVNIDGRECEVLKPDEMCMISRSEKSLKFITFSENRTFRNLFRKMKIYENL